MKWGVSMSDVMARAKEELLFSGCARVDHLSENERSKLIQWAVKNLTDPLTGKKVAAMKQRLAFDNNGKPFDALVVSQTVRDIVQDGYYR